MLPETFTCSGENGWTDYSLLSDFLLLNSLLIGLIIRTVLN